jgi:hypothetical protein
MNTITPRNDTEALLLEKFQALLADLDTAGDTAQLVMSSTIWTITSFCTVGNS